MKKFINYFFNGLLFVAPVAATVYIIYKTFQLIDNILPFDIPGLGIIVILVTITLVGYITSFYVSNPIFAFLERSIERTPLIKIIYGSVKDMIEAFVGEKKRFSSPVLVTTNKDPLIQRIGFITQNDLQPLGMMPEQVAVYLPFSYGMNGMLMIVSRENVKPIDASGTEMMKFVISGGVTDVDLPEKTDLHPPANL